MADKTTAQIFAQYKAAIAAMQKSADDIADKIEATADTAVATTLATQRQVFTLSIQKLSYVTVMTLDNSTDVANLAATLNGVLKDLTAAQAKIAAVGAAIQSIGNVLTSLSGLVTSVSSLVKPGSGSPPPPPPPA